MTSWWDNPWIRSRLASAVRAAVYVVTGLLVDRNILTPSESDSLVTEVVAWAVPAILAGAAWTWSHRSDLHKRLKLLTGLGVGRPITEHEANAIMKAGLGATDVTTPKTEVPVTGLSALPVSDRLL